MGEGSTKDAVMKSIERSNQKKLAVPDMKAALASVNLFMEPMAANETGAANLGLLESVLQGSGDAGTVADKLDGIAKQKLSKLKAKKKDKLVKAKTFKRARKQLVKKERKAQKHAKRMAKLAEKH